MKNVIAIAAIASASILLSSCNNQSPKKEVTPQEVSQQSSLYISIADTITSPVIIRNNDPSDIWTEQYLSQLDRSLFINTIFKGIYEGQLQPYDFMTEKAIRIKDIKALESNDEFDRSLIGRVLFSEKWEMDTENYRMNKKVLSVVLGYEVKNSAGEIKGYKPAFMVHFNE